MKESKRTRYRTSKTLRRRKIDVANINIGMSVVELDRPWSETPFLFQGFTLENHKDLETLKEYCNFIYIEVAEEEWVEYKSSKKSKVVKRTRFVEKKSIVENVKEANKTYQSAKRHIQFLLTSVQLGHAFSLKDTRLIVSECVNKVMENSSAILWLTRLKKSDDYTAEHSINVSLLAIALGRYLGLEKKALENLGISALLHDIGKMNIPPEILNKPSRLDDDEFCEMAKHTDYARKLLLERDDVYLGAVDVAYSHHERLDGSGYPRGISGNQISTFTRIVSIVDAYDAMTSERCYKKGVSSLEALRILHKNSGSQFDEEIVQKFIAMIGLYPAGYIIEMSNGEVGIILSHDKGYQLRPKVILVLDKNKQPQPESIINLSHYPKDYENLPYKAKSVFRNGAFGINVKDYIERGLKIKGMENSELSEALT